MYKNSIFFQFIVIGLTLAAGVFIGLSFTDFDIPVKWNAELKFGDLISIAVGLLTFVFAYKGITDNRRVTELSFKPRLFEHTSFLSIDKEFKIEIKNAGLGSALGCVYKYYIDGEEISDKRLDKKVIDLCRMNSEAKIFMGKGQVILPGQSIVIVEVKAGSQEDYAAIQSFLSKRLGYTVTFKDGLGNSYSETFMAASSGKDGR